MAVSEVLILEKLDGMFSMIDFDYEGLDVRVTVEWAKRYVTINFYRYAKEGEFQLGLLEGFCEEPYPEGMDPREIVKFNLPKLLVIAKQNLWHTLADIPLIYFVFLEIPK